MRIFSVLLALMLMGSSALKAQCVDTLAWPLDNPPCYPDFIPVCGCDEVTYPNFCYWEHAALFFYEEGPCEQVAFRFYPNPVMESLFLRLATRFESDINLYIFDSSGNVMYYRYLRDITNDQLIIPVYEYRQGLYFIIAESMGETYSSKFLKWDMN